jgi:hypothetical protein
MPQPDLDAETRQWQLDEVRQAKPVQVVIAGQPFVAQPKLNTTGGEAIKVQIGLNLTVVGSKAKAPTPLP